MTRWSTGYLLLTRDTKKWTNEQKSEANEIEQHLIFKHFSSRDAGKSRVLIKKCETKHEARNTTARHNNLCETVDTLKKIYKNIQRDKNDTQKRDNQIR